jgi:photosystem II stability/assembly factor-like uncharacterized protein
MRKFIIVLFLIITCFNNNLFSQTGTWRIVDSLKSKLYQTHSLVAIDCADTSNCAILGNYGWTWPMISTTTNGGEEWEINYIDSITKGDQDMYIPANEICYPDTSLCIMVCDEGYYYISRDKCITWEKFRLGIQSLYSISFINKENGGIISYYDLYLTNDGGKIWSHQNVSEFHIEEKYIPYLIEYIHYYNPQLIFMNLYRKDIYNYIVKSVDGGMTWKFLYNFPQRVTNILFMDELTGFAVGRPKVNTGIHKDVIYKTTDGGISWENKLDTIVKGKAGLKQIYFSDKNNGVALGLGWDLWRTSDGGDNWFQDSSYYSGRFNTDAADIALLGSTKKFLMINQLGGLVIKYSEDGIVNVNEDKPLLKNGFKIYPNILSSGESIRIEVNTGNPGLNKIQIYNSIGSIIDSYEFYSSGDSYTLDYTPPAGIAAGQYFVILKNTDNRLLYNSLIIR